MTQVLQKLNTGATNSNNAIIIVKAKAGSLLVSFCGQSGSLLTPSVTDNEAGVPGEGWTIHTLKAEGGTNKNGAWVAYKIAKGGETEIKWTAGGGVMQGVVAFEAEGLSTEIDTSASTNNAEGESIVSPAINTVDPTSILFAAVLDATQALSTFSWTSTGAEMVPTTSTGGAGTSRGFGGYCKPETKLVNIKFTGKWAASRKVEMLLIAFKAASPPHYVSVKGGGKVTLKAGTYTLGVHGGGQVALTSEAFDPRKKKVHGGGVVTFTGSVPPEPGLGEEGPEAEILHEILVQGGGQIKLVSKAEGGAIPGRLPSLKATATSDGHLTLTAGKAAVLPLAHGQASSGGQLTLSVKSRVFLILSHGQAFSNTEGFVGIQGAVAPTLRWPSKLNVVANPLTLNTVIDKTSMVLDNYG